MHDYLAWKASTTKNPATPLIYGMWVRRFLKFLNGRPITLETANLFRTHLREIGYSPKNIQYGMQLTRDYISYQVTMHSLDFPLRLLKIPMERSNSHHAVTKEEFERMIRLVPKNEPQSLQRRLMLMLLWDTGMRVGELTRLKISDLKKQEAIIHNEKNHRSRRIGWSAETEKLLQFYLPLRNHMVCKEDFLFVSFKWKPTRKLTTRQIERIIEDLRKEAKIENEVRPHSFRHGFVHRQLAKRTPVTTIAQMLGHSTTANVLTYAQLNSTEIKEAWAM